MTQHERHTTDHSWRYYRSAFRRRSGLFPALAPLVTIIDRICQRGYSERLYAGASLDNLVISTHPKPRDHRQTILVIPKEDTVEFRLYAEEGEAEVCTVALNQVESTIDSLLFRLVADDLET
ncbi:MAG TPA: hypothetical protein VN688_07160 [Gemmataceae bacterium]|nr:hypothetical protein [Gemmataceae bacterium]